MICVDCGKPGATEGSSKHPYCERCFKKRWKNDYMAYYIWLAITHDRIALC